MKLSLNWAQYYSNVDLKSIGKDELLKSIGEQLGAVDEVIEWGPRFDGIVVAKVITCEKHTNADKLHVCMIDDSGVVKGVKRNKDGLVQVVCGAPNVAAGQLVAWIPPGVTVPSTYDKDPFVLESREIRGEISNGMLASPAELGISSDHNGILVIEPSEVGEKLAKRGIAFKSLYGLDDIVIDIENKMFTHRPDCFGILGLARELSGINHKAFKSPEWYDEFAKVDQGSKTLPLEITNDAEKLVPRFSAVSVAGVSVGPSPIFMQSALTRVGIKPINNIVDVTNFVMHLTGQPIHAYDYDKVKTAKLGVRLSKKGEELTLLGGKKIKLQDGAIVITDGQKPIGLGGIMGGADTEVDRNTKNIIIECANFDMNLIRKTSMTYGLFTDASTRFTKGQSARQNIAVLAYAVSEIKKYAGGQVASKVQDLRSAKSKENIVKIDNAKQVGDKLGLSGLTIPAVKHLLGNVEFEFVNNGTGVGIIPPFWRTDIEILEDIVEEFGRLYGYDNLPVELPIKSIEPVQNNPMLELKSKIRELMSAAGANEVLTYSFVHGSLLEAAGQNPRNTFHLKNALSPDLQYYRISLAPSLLDKVHANVKQGYKDYAIFELGSAHNRETLDAQKLPKEQNSLGFVITKASSAGAPYYQAKHYVEYLLGYLNVYNLEYLPFDERSRKYADAAYEPKRSAYIKSGNKILGVVGEPNQQLRTFAKLPNNTAMFELDLDVVIALVKDPIYTPINRFPSTEQDLCLRTDTDPSYREITDFVTSSLLKLTRKHDYYYHIWPIDIYEKDKDAKKKQTTWRISLYHPERTLTTIEVNKLLDELAILAKDKIGAERI